MPNRSLFLICYFSSLIFMSGSLHAAPELQDSSCSIPTEELACSFEKSAAGHPSVTIDIYNQKGFLDIVKCSKAVQAARDKNYTVFAGATGLAAFKLFAAKGALQLKLADELRILEEIKVKSADAFARGELKTAEGMEITSSLKKVKDVNRFDVEIAELEKWMQTLKQGSPQLNKLESSLANIKKVISDAHLKSEACDRANQEILRLRQIQPQTPEIAGKINAKLETLFRASSAKIENLNKISTYFKEFAFQEAVAAGVSSHNATKAAVGAEIEEQAIKAAAASTQASSWKKIGGNTLRVLATDLAIFGVLDFYASSLIEMKDRALATMQTEKIPAILNDRLTPRQLCSNIDESKNQQTSNEFAKNMAILAKSPKANSSKLGLQNPTSEDRLPTH